MIPPEDGKCSNCIYFKNKGAQGLKLLYSLEEDSDKVEGNGVCTRYPPIIIVINSRIVSRSSLTHETLSCGEWVPDSRR